MIKKILIGNDLVCIPRFEEALKISKFIEKIFHPQEIDYCEKKNNAKAASYAARYAAKEAFAKALGTGLYANGITFKDIWIVNEESGRPLIELSEKMQVKLKAENIVAMDVSLSHHVDYALATVLLQKG